MAATDPDDTLELALSDASRAVTGGRFDYSILFLVIPLTAACLGVWVLAWVGAYPHNDLGAAYGKLMGVFATLGGVILVAVVVTVRAPSRAAAAVVGGIPLCVAILGVFWMADLDGPEPDPCGQAQPHRSTCTQPTPAPTAVPWPNQ